MSAAATAAGYLYASGRLRSRNAEAEHRTDTQQPMRKTRVAVIEPEAEATPEKREKKTPKIQYRTRRWKPE